MVTIEHKQSKPTVQQGLHLNLNNFKTIEAMGLKINTLRSHGMALPPHQISCNSTKSY
jgi:hypothetical protein